MRYPVGYRSAKLRSWSGLHSGTPRHIGPYEILEIVGQGGMASVYKAYQPALDRLVAVKVISPALAQQPEFMIRFQQEAMAAARLRHANIVVVHDFGEEQGLAYLVMEFVEGRPLSEIVATGVPLGLAASVITQVADGLDYAHARGVVHRDVKPQNVLLSSEGHAVLVDFGLARMLESTAQSVTLAGGTVGTPEYMSPEQAAGRPVDHRSDIYSLGIVAFELLTGSKPFTGATPLSVLLKHLQSPIPTLRFSDNEVGGRVDAVLKRTLAKNPNDRYPRATDFARALAAAVTGAEKVAAVPVDGNSSSRLIAQRSPMQSDARVRTAPVLPSAERLCPACGKTIQRGLSVCSTCTFMLPFPAEPPRKGPTQRRELHINLLPFRYPWDPDGLRNAREAVKKSVQPLLLDGWELVTPTDGPGVLRQGRGARGPVVQGAVVLVQRRD